MIKLLQQKAVIFSVKKGLFLIAIVQFILTLLFLLYSITLSTYKNYNDVTNRYFQVGEQLLSNAESAISYLESVTLFPSQLHSQNNDAYISKTLRDNSINRNYKFYNYFNTHAQNKFVNDSLDFVALYDLKGNGVASFRDSVYQLCFVQNSPSWYGNMVKYNTGISILIPSDTFYGSGLHSRDYRSICAIRGIVDPNSFKIVGYCVAGISTEWLTQAFNTIRLSPNQNFELYKDNLKLFGNISNDVPIRDWISQDSFESENMTKRILKRENGKYFVYNIIGHSNGYALLMKTPLSDIMGTVSKIQLYYTVFISIFLFILICLIIYIVKTILDALKRLMDACNCFELDHATKLSCENLPQELQTLFASFNRMSERISFLVHEVFMKQKAQQETELQLLRTQINPHYLYNTLEIMHMKAYSHGDYDVSAMAELLGQNLQYGLRNTTKEVLLKEEISQLNIYLSILSYQFKDRIRTNICIEEELMECRVIKLLFQPVIENAVIHGITSNDQILSIDILGYRSENTILIQISDDGCGMTEKQLEALKNDMESSGSNGIGLRNVFRRIQLNYGPEYTLEVNSKYGLGTTITLHLPWQPADTQEEE
ncbi:hypothetical protein C0033_20965 [Clostridium sp. chh4-2]|nr:hypothetical protein C0033_20965 [Clostridium sp. chh4-2]